MNRVVHFEIHADNPERCVEFYSKVFGWDIKKWASPAMEYWVVMTGPKDAPDGINGGIIRRHGPAPTLGQPVSSFVCTIDVPNFDETAAKIEAAGCKVALAKMAIPGMAWQGYFIDTEGNIFGVHQLDLNAK